MHKYTLQGELRGLQSFELQGGLYGPYYLILRNQLAQEAFLTQITTQNVNGTFLAYE